jgi:hypothetical protein
LSSCKTLAFLCGYPSHHPKQPGQAGGKVLQTSLTKDKEDELRHVIENAA